MRVLIFEPQFRGHNLVHAARLVRALRELPCEAVVATSSQAAASPEYGLHLAGEQQDFRLVTLDGFPTDRAGLAIRTSGVGAPVVYRALVRAINRVRPDHVYIPYGNLLARLGGLPLGLAGALRGANAEAEVLLVGGKYLYPKTGLAARLRQRATLGLIARGPWTRLFHLDDAAVDLLQSRGGRLARITRLLPEPVGDHPRVDPVAARDALGLPTTGRAIAVVGLIELRKGVEVLLEAIRRSADRLWPTDRLLLLGPHHPSVRSLLAEKHADLVGSGRVVSLDQQLSEAQMTRAVSAADVVATIYPHHPYASGVLVAAAAMGRPVLGSNNGWIDRTIRRFDLGATCDPGDVQSVADAVLEMLRARPAAEPSEAARRFREFTADANYQALWTERLRQRLGMPPSPSARTWQWALTGAGERAPAPLRAAA